MNSLQLKNLLSSDTTGHRIFFIKKIQIHDFPCSFEKLQFLFYSSSFIMEPRSKLRNFFGSGFKHSIVKIASISLLQCLFITEENKN